jgi:hypothetical protein
MSVKFSKLMTDCLVSLGDEDASTWDRTDVIWPWCIEAMMAFPILRGMELEYTMLAASHKVTLPADFREIISIEYPINQEPPVYLTRLNHLDPAFYEALTFYDIDRDYKSGSGWFLFVSKLLAIGEKVRISYLANHSTDVDDANKLITIPDEYENILIAYVVAKAYRERLGVYMQDPTAHTSVILQMTDTVRKSEDNYHQLVLRAQEKLALSRTSPNLTSDKYDRVY